MVDWSRSAISFLRTLLQYLANIAKCTQVSADKRCNQHHRDCPLCPISRWATIIKINCCDLLVNSLMQWQPAPLPSETQQRWRSETEGDELKDVLIVPQRTFEYRVVTRDITSSRHYVIELTRGSLLWISDGLCHKPIALLNRFMHTEIIKNRAQAGILSTNVFNGLTFSARLPTFELDLRLQN